MQIDPNQVVWDSGGGGIDPSAVQWDDAPQQQANFNAVEKPTAFDDFLVKFGNTSIGKQLSGAFQ